MGSPLNRLHRFLVALQGEPALDPEALPDDAEAIIILGAAAARLAPEYGGTTVGSFALVRLRYGASLHRRTQLPVLVTGGPVHGMEVTAAELMAETLEQELGTPVRWQERRAFNTHENALFAAEMLEAEGIRRVLVVTHAFHIQRLFP